MSQEEQKKARSHGKRAVTRQVNKLKRSSVEGLDVKAESECLKQLFEKFEELHYVYVEASGDDNEEYFEEVQEKYIAVMAQLKSSPEEKNSKESERDVTDGILNALTKMQLPKVEIQPFEGDPLQYYSFMMVFTETVEQVIDDKRACLTRLLQYTTGRAHDAIKNCALIKGDLAYTKAQEILVKRFGNEHIILDSVLRSFREGGAIRSSEDIAKYADTLSTGVTIVTQMGRLHEIDSQRLILEVIEKLPSYMFNKWKKFAVETKRRTNYYPDITSLVTFMMHQADEITDPVYGQSASSTSSFKQERQPKKQVFAVSDTSQSLSCFLCNECHYLNQCSKFLAMSLKERYDFVLNKRLCRNCLHTGHIAGNCKRSSLCKHCKCKHNTVLHDHDFQAKPVNSNDSAVRSVQSESVLNVIDVNNARAGISCVEVLVEGKNALFKCKAIVDAKATVNLCTNRLASRLNLESSESEISLSTVTGSFSVKGQLLKNVKVFSHDMCSHVLADRILSVNSIPLSMESVFNRDDLVGMKHLEGVELPTVADTQEIDLLIGSGVPKAFHQFEVRRGTDSDIVAVKMTLGWDLVGMKRSSLTKSAVVLYTGMVSNPISCCEISSDLSRVFKDDFADCALFDCRKGPSIEDIKAMELVETSAIVQDGQFCVGVPWKQDPRHLPSSKQVVLGRLRALQKRFLQDSALHECYRKEMQKFIDNGFLEVSLRSNSDTELCHYVPHHPVWHPRKGSLRIVWDCAVSLNDFIYQGPDLINSLTDVLIRFRRFKWVVCSDIQKMYLNVKIPPCDRGALRVLWWPNGDFSKQPVEYRATVHIYGAKSSGFVANYCVKKLAQSSQCPVSEVLMQDFYVDDQLSSFQTEEEAIYMAQSLQEVLKQGGFRLTKFVSNSLSIMKAVPDCDHAESVDLVLGKNEYEHSVLGLQWLVQADQFCFSCQLPDIGSIPSRRLFLSVIAHVYDPLGIVSPAVLQGKIVMQQKSSLGWDETDDVLKEQWFVFHDLLTQVSNFCVARCLHSSSFDKSVHISLHGFADASKDGYAAAVYVRQVDSKGEICVSFLQGKSRVAPKFKGHVPQATIPKLELNSAALMAKLLRKVECGLGLPVDDVYFWSDSQAVLMCINATDQRFPLYWSNRIAIILGNSSPVQWRYVPSRYNPADVGSRGVRPKKFEEDMSFWTKGPSFLQDAPDEWPSMMKIPAMKEVLMVSDLNSSPDVGNELLCHIIHYYSSFSKLLRVVSRLIRFMHNVRLKERKDLQVSDIEDAKMQLIKYDQRSLVVSNLRKLKPFQDDSGMWRVRSRLSQSNLSYDTKFPIILPKDSHLTGLIVKDAHKSSCHSGPTHVLYQLRRHFWIVNGRHTVKKHLSDCGLCRKKNAQRLCQEMAPLPVERVNSSHPFQFVGLDYFGPFMCKVRRTRVKRYGCIFVCLTTRALHIECVNSLETASFLCAFSRFISRRGVPDKVYSDNATNFQGAQEELKKVVRSLDVAANQFSLSKGIQWHFHPPLGSHHGGHYERLIRSVRSTLYGITNEQELSEDNLVTFLCEAEKVLNDRPLTVMSNDPEDVPLSPSMILLLRGNSCAAMFESVDQPKRFHKQAQYLCDIFWKRFLREYVPSLIQRQKWLVPKRNLKDGDLVLMSDEGFPRGHWPIARVAEVFPDTDGLVRKVSVKTKNGLKIRPITKLALFEAST